MITRFYYSLKELVDDEILTGFNKLLSNWNISYTDNTYTTELYNHVDEDYYYDFIAYIDVEHEPWEPIEKPSVADIKSSEDYLTQMMKFMKKIKGWLDDSDFRYEKLIELYQDENDDLLDAIKSTVKFNDTPQTTTTGLDGDGYASTYSVSTTEGSTIMNRLNEIRTYWISLYGEWAEEFAKKFVIYND